MAVVAGFDVSREATGWAVGNVSHETPARSGVWRLPNDLTRALVSLRQAVAGLCREWHVTDAFIEAPMMRQDDEHGSRAAFVLVGLAAVARECAASHGARVEMPAAPTWRKTVYGNPWPSMPKELAIRYCESLGSPVDTHDEAEAWLIWRHGVIRLGFPVKAAA